MAEDDQKAKISTQITDAAKDAIARKLIKHWEKLQTIMPEFKDVPVPTPAQLMGDATTPDGITGQLIKQRKYTFKDKNGKEVPFDLKDVDKKIDEYVAKLGGTAAKTFRDSIGLIDTMVPTQKALDEITEAAHKGVSSQTGTGNTILSFLQAALTWILSALGSIFSGEKATSFGQAMADTIAPGIKTAVHSELLALAQDPGKASYGLLNMQDSDGKTPVDRISEEAYKAAVKEAGGTVPPPPEGTAVTLKLEDVKPTGFDTDDIRTAIAKQLMNPPPGPDGKPAPTLNTMIYDELVKRKKEFVGNSTFSFARDAVAPADESLKTAANRMADVITKTIANRITDPEFKHPDRRTLDKLDADEFSALIADEVGKELKAASDAKTIKLGRFVSLTDTVSSKGPDKDKTYIDLFKMQLAERIKPRHKEFAPVFEFMATKPPMMPEKSAADRMKEALEKTKNLVLGSFDTDNNKQISEAEAKTAVAEIIRIRTASNGDTELDAMEIKSLKIDPKDTTKIEATKKLLAADTALLNEGINIAKPKLTDVMAAMKANGILETPPGVKPGSKPVPNKPEERKAGK